jgi:DNA replication protein DnaC
MLQQIPNVTTSTNLYADNELEGNHCCLKCQQEMRRIPVTIPRKEGNCIVMKSVFAMPAACKCEVARMQKEEEVRERKERRAAMEKAYKRSIMSDDLKGAMFQTFLPRAGAEHVRREAEKFVDDFERRKHGLFFYGKPGNGKSHLMASIHHELDRQGYVCLFLDCSQLFNLARDTMNKNSKVSLTDIITAAVDCDLLTLDELGSGSLSEYEFNDVLFPIINGRQGKKTNYTSNLDLIRLKQWFAMDKYKNPVDPDGRLIDRILGSCDICENLATSKRQEDAMRRMGTA